MPTTTSPLTTPRSGFVQRPFRTNSWGGQGMAFHLRIDSAYALKPISTPNARHATEISVSIDGRHRLRLCFLSRPGKRPLHLLYRQSLPLLWVRPTASLSKAQSSRGRTGQRRLGRKRQLRWIPSRARQFSLSTGSRQAD
jgi:hypothetical protein